MFLFFRPEWNESFSLQQAGMSEIKVYIKCDLGEKLKERCVATTFISIGELKSMGKDNEKISFTQQMNPTGLIKMEITLFPKENKLKRRKAVHEKNYNFNGHRYFATYFMFFTKCAHCKVIIC